LRSGRRNLPRHGTLFFTTMADSSPKSGDLPSRDGLKMPFPGVMHDRITPQAPP